MGGAGELPAPVGDPPAGTAASNVAKSPCPLARTAAPVPSGESPEGTGGSPVLPANHFSNTLVEVAARVQVEAGGSSFFAEGPLGRSTCGGGTWVAQVMPDCAWKLPCSTTVGEGGMTMRWLQPGHWICLPENLVSHWMC